MSLRARLRHTLRDQLDRPCSTHRTLLRLSVLRVATKLGSRLEVNAPGSWEYRWMRGVRERAMAAQVDELVAIAMELQRELDQWRGATPRDTAAQDKKTVELAAVA